MEKSIFRLYDIRGTIGVDLFENDAYTLGRAYGSYIENKKVMVGYDNRLSSPSLAANLIKGLIESGVDVINIGLVTTPMLYFSRYDLNIFTAIMITASHNPANDNGFKISFDDRGNACGEEITLFRDFVLKGEFNSGKGKEHKYSIVSDYVDLIVGNIYIDKKLKVAFDAGNGTTSIIIKNIIDKLNIDPIYLYCDDNGTFPNHHPDPAVSSNLDDLIECVKNNSCDLGMAFDADGDRVRLVDNLGNILNTDEFMAIIYKNMNDRLKVRKGMYDVKCSLVISDTLDELGLENIMYKTGNSYMFRKTLELGLDFSGEYSGHIWFGDRFKAFDDGIYAGLRMVELLSKSDLSLSEIRPICKYLSTDEIKIKTSDDKKTILVSKVADYCVSKGYEFSDIDGVRVMFKDGWALIRQSNTGPHLTVRFEASSKEFLEKISLEFTTFINKNL